MNEPTLGEILAGVLCEQAELESWAQAMCAGSLAKDLSTRFDKRSVELYELLRTVPSESLALLQSPEGWTALCGILADKLGQPIRNYRPTVH